MVKKYIPSGKSFRRTAVKSKIRGKTLENIIMNGFDYLNVLKPKEFKGVRLETPFIETKDGEFIRTKKQPADWLVMSSWGIFLFDTKECAAEKFYPKKKAIEYQRQSLINHQDMGYIGGINYIGGFLVWFTKNSAIEIAIATEAIRFIEDLDSPATIKSGKPFNWDMFFKR